MKFTQYRVSGFIFRDLVRSYCVHGNLTMLIKRQFLRNVRFDLNLKSSQEYDLMIQLSRICRFDFVPQVLCESKDSINQITYNSKKKIHGKVVIFNKYKESCKFFGIMRHIACGSTVSEGKREIPE